MNLSFPRKRETIFFNRTNMTPRFRADDGIKT